MTKTLSERIAEIEIASQLETFGFKTEPSNETAEKIILEFLKCQKWVAQKSMEIIKELQAENQALLAKNRELEGKGWLPIELADKSKHITHHSSILLTDGKDVFEGYCNDDWVKTSNENLAFATHFMLMPKPPTKTKGE